MKAVVSHEKDGDQQTLCWIKNGALLIAVTTSDGQTVAFVELDEDATRDLYDLLDDHYEYMKPTPDTTSAR